MTCRKFDFCYFTHKVIYNREETNKYIDTCLNYGIGCDLEKLDGIEFKVTEKLEKRKK